MIRQLFHFAILPMHLYRGQQNLALLFCYSFTTHPKHHNTIFLGKCFIPLSPFMGSVTDYINLSVIDFKMLTVKINYKLKILSFYS